MKEWCMAFWKEHGSRLVFMGMAMVIATVLFVWVPSMRGEAKTVVVGVMMLLFNKARSTPVKEETVDDSSK